MKRNKAFFFASLIVSILIEAFIRYGSFAFTHRIGYVSWPWIDNVSHFSWGISGFLLFLTVLEWSPLDSLLGVLMFHMLWEGVEIIGDRLFEESPFGYDHF